MSRRVNKFKLGDLVVIVRKGISTISVSHFKQKGIVRRIIDHRNTYGYDLGFADLSNGGVWEDEIELVSAVHKSGTFGAHLASKYKVKEGSMWRVPEPINLPEPTIKTFQITVRETRDLFYEVQAENEQAARELVNDGEVHWDDDECVDWAIIHIQETEN